VLFNAVNKTRKANANVNVEHSNRMLASHRMQELTNAMTIQEIPYNRIKKQIHEFHALRTII